jgi:hypothetical protein
MLTLRVEVHDLLSEIVDECSLLHEFHKNVLDLGNDRTLDHLVEDLETAMIG